ncbi:MAG: hemolysin family protein [Bryobacteraceae bacterium]
MLSDLPFRLLLVAVILAANGFFAAAEVALLSVRRSRLRQMAEGGVAGAQTALTLLANPERLLSVVQVGVTIASLGLGWAGEDTLYQLILEVFHPAWSPATAAYIQAGGLVIAFAAISYLHVVLGEVLPKNMALDKADRLAVLVAPPLLVFSRISLPFIVVIERSAAALSRALRLRAAGAAGGHSAEELKMIVSSSRGLGFLPENQEEMIHRVLDLDRISVREIMVPRNGIVSVPENASLDEVLATMIEQQHSRLPVYEGRPEHIIGLLHYKDLLPVWQERRAAMRSGRPLRPFHIRRLMRQHLVVPETKPLAQMLDEFRQGRSHMAMVVDEFGTIVGLVTVEDVLEEIVGAIADEYDEAAPARPETESGPLDLDGATLIRDLETGYGIAVPGERGFETLAGFILYKLGRIPQPGETVEYDGRRFTVTEMDRHRITRVQVEKAT